MSAAVWTQGNGVGMPSGLADIIIRNAAILIMLKGVVVMLLL